MYSGEFGEDQLVHQVVETILNATATKAAEEPLPHADPVAPDNNNGMYFFVINAQTVLLADWLSQCTIVWEFLVVRIFRGYFERQNKLCGIILIKNI